MVGWARVYPALQRTISKTLRRGAWYAVVHNDLPDRVFIQMGSRSVAVPRRILEVRRQRPDYFSVVYRSDADAGTNSDAAMRHVVCPNCARRLKLWGQPIKYRCPNCTHQGDVGWWEV